MSDNKKPDWLEPIGQQHPANRQNAASQLHSTAIRSKGKSESNGMPQMRRERKKEREGSKRPTAVSVQDLQKNFHQTGAEASRQHESPDG